MNNKIKKNGKGIVCSLLFLFLLLLFMLSCFQITYALQISNVEVTAAATTSATIEFDTDEEARVKLKYGIGTPDTEIESDETGTHHVFSLTELTSGARYRYTITQSLRKQGMKKK